MTLPLQSHKHIIACKEIECLMSHSSFAETDGRENPMFLKGLQRTATETCLFHPMLRLLFQVKPQLPPQLPKAFMLLRRALRLPHHAFQEALVLLTSLPMTRATILKALNKQMMFSILGETPLVLFMQGLSLRNLCTLQHGAITQVPVVKRDTPLLRQARSKLLSGPRQLTGLPSRPPSCLRLRSLSLRHRVFHGRLGCRTSRHAFSLV